MLDIDELLMTHQRQSPQQLIGEQYSYHLLHWMVMLWLLLELLELTQMKLPSRVFDV